MTSFLRRTDWAFVSLLAVIFCAPFERSAPLLVLPGQNLTNLELVTAAALLIWLFRSARERSLPPLRGHLTLPILLLVGLFLLSALLVAPHPAEALRFTGRLILGVLIYFLVVDLCTSRSRLRAVIFTLTAAGVLVALLGLFEYWQVSGVGRLLELFHPGSFYVAGRTRVSSTLQYSTIASMYLELALAWGLAALLWWRPSRTWPLTILPALLVIGAAVFLTMTRAGLVTIAVVLFLATGLLLGRRGLGWETRRLLVLDASLVVVCLASLATTDFGLRLRVPDESLWYRAAYRVPPQLTMEAGSLTEIQVSVENQGLVTWTREPANPIRLAYHWVEAESGEVVLFEGLRTGLGGEVRPAQSVRLDARVQAPPEAGEYRLAWDMLKEHHFWFSMQASEMGTTRVIVLEGSGDRFNAVDPSAQLPLPRARFSISRAELWRIATRMIREHPFLGVGPDNFRLTYGDWIGEPEADRSYHSHNLYLEFFVSAGIAGGLLFLWLVFRILSQLRRLWTRGSDIDLAFRVGAVAGATAILVHGFVDYFLEFTPLNLIIWASFGLIIAGDRLAKESDPAERNLPSLRGG